MKVEKKGAIYILLLDSLSCKMLFWTRVLVGWCFFFPFPIFIFDFQYE